MVQAKLLILGFLSVCTIQGTVGRIRVNRIDRFRNKEVNGLFNTIQAETKGESNASVSNSSIADESTNTTGILEAQTAINGSNATPTTEKPANDSLKTTESVPAQNGLSAKAVEELTLLAKQKSNETTVCSKQCSPFWLSAIELSVGQLPPDHAICENGNYTSCSPAESVCETVPTKIVCCPMECLTPIRPCYTGPETANMCIPIDVTHWVKKMRKQGVSLHFP